MSQIGEYLKAKRMKLNLSIRKAAQQAHISNAYLSMIESGERGAPHPNILQKLSTVYGEDPTSLMKIAGYLDSDPTEQEAAEVERLYNEAASDKKVGIGTRLREEPNFETKRAIAKIYKAYKEGKRRGKRKRKVPTKG